MASALVAASLIASCGSSRTAATARPSGNAPQKNEAKAPVPKHIVLTDELHMPEATVRLLKEADRWIGVPYLYGGNDKEGVDCSGFVLQVYKTALGIMLPRNSAKQQEFATITSRDRLREGDLVFFTVRGGKNVGHVGIYIGDGRMIHASSSKGVIISPLSQKYYVDNFHSCGHIEQYYALLEKGTEKSASPTERLQASSASDSDDSAVKRSQKSEARPEAQDKAQVKAQPRTPDRSAGKRVRAAASPVRAIGTAKTSAPRTDMNADRSKVLESMIELKADSIFSQR